MSISNLFALSSLSSKAKSGTLTPNDIVELGQSFGLNVPHVLAPVLTDAVGSVAAKVGDGGAAQGILDRVAVVYSDMRAIKAKSVDAAKLYRVSEAAGMSLDELQCETVAERIREYANGDETLWQFCTGASIAKMFAGIPAQAGLNMADVECPHCGAHGSVPEEALGSVGRCESCNNPFFLQ